MKKVINAGSAISMTIFFIMMFMFVTYTRLANIDMTETRLLFTYWKEYLILSTLLIVSAVFYKFTEE